jgi:hypothetical protein
MFDLIIMEKSQIENGRDGGYRYTRLHHKPPLQVESIGEEGYKH